MDFKAYMHQVEKQILCMGEKDLKKWAINQARMVNKKDRNNFLNSFKEIDMDYKSQVEGIVESCRKISEGELKLECSYCETGEYDYYYHDAEYEYVYRDPNGIVEMMQKGFETAENMLDNKCYEEALIVYEALSYIEVEAYDEDGEDSQYLRIEDLVSENIVNVNLKKVAIDLLYLNYIVSEKDDRIETIFGVYSLDIAQNVKLEDIFSNGPEALKDINSFMNNWIDFLKEKRGSFISELLEDAIIYKDGMEGLLVLAEQFPNKYPEYYVKYFQDVLERKEFKIILDKGRAALEKIDKTKILRSKIAYIMAISAKELNNKEEERIGLYATFESDPCAKNYLKLINVFDEPELKNTAMAWVSLFHAGQAKQSSDNLKEPGKININDENYYSIKFFNRDFEEVWSFLKKDKKTLGWSNHLKGIIIPLFLITLTGKSEFTKVAEEKIKKLESRLEYQKERDEKELIEYLMEWKNKVNLSEEEQKKYFSWCEEEVKQRVSSIVSNQYRKAYSRAVELIILLAEASNFCGFSYKEEVVKKYKKMFPRHSSYQSEFLKYGY